MMMAIKRLFIDGGGPCAGVSGPLSDDVKDMDNGEVESYDDNKEQEHGDPMDGPNGSRGTRVGHGTSGPCLHDHACQMPNIFSNE